MPRISGFSFIRDGVKLDFPFLESYRSLLPLVDEMVVVVGESSDRTLDFLKELAREMPKVKVLTSKWDEGLRKDGLILSQQTNLALAKCTGDWGIYIQADEAFHEEDYKNIIAKIGDADQRPEVDGLLFSYLHFYGDFSIINRNPSAYRNEIRAIKLGRRIESFKDAQGFRKRDADGNLIKLNVIHSEARVFHYGWVRPPQKMQEKTVVMDRLYHLKEEATGDNHRYKHIIGLEKFLGTHPKVMQARIHAKNWNARLLEEKLEWSWGDIRKIFALLWEKLTGELPFSYRNYIRVD